MTKSVLHIRVVYVLACMLFCLQTVSAAHGVLYGDASHDHDGVVCELGTANIEEIAVLPACTVVTIIRYVLPLPHFHLKSRVFWDRPPGQAPPPRGPPFNNQ